MSRSIADFFILLFIYTIDGTPLGDKPESREIKYGYLTYYKPDSWGKDTEVAFHWPRGVVQYLFDNSSYDDMLKDKLRLSMKSLEKESCVRFKEMTKKPSRNTSSWLHFTNQNKERGCFHTPTPQKNGEIQVILGYDCLKQSEITHALMHGIGFRDEVTHPNRDLYVKILWNNIQPAHWKLFGRYVTDEPELLSEYDPKSIMHFHDHAFSVNGQATISGLIPGLKIAPSEYLSHLDKMKLGLKFGHECNKRKVGELLETCQDIFSKNKKVSSNEADDPKPITQDATHNTDKINSDEHNVIILGRDEKVKSENKNTSNSFNVDPPEPGNNNDQSEESEIPQEPHMDFNYESGENQEPQMDSDNQTDQSDENSKEKSMSSSDSDSSSVGHKDNEHGNHKESDVNLGNDNNKYDMENEKGLSYESENVSPPKFNFDLDSGDIESENTNEGDTNMVVFNNNKKLRPNSKNIAAQNDTKISHEKNVKHVNITNKDDVNIVVIGHHNKLRPDSKNIAAQNDTNTSSVGYNHVYEENSKTLDKHDSDSDSSSVGNKDNEHGNHKVFDVNLGGDNNKYNKENEEGLSYESENVSPPRLNFDLDSRDIESENTNKGDTNIVVFNNDKKLRPNSKSIAAQNDTKISHNKNVNITNKDYVNIVVIGHHNKIQPHSKNIAAQDDTKISHEKNVKHVNITKQLLDNDTGTDNVRLKQDNFKLAYVDIANISGRGDNTYDYNDDDENDANNTDDNKVI